MKKVLLSLLFVSLLSVGVPASAQSAHQYKNPTGKEFPIMSWYSILPPHIDKGRYEELAEAGFNLSFSHFSSADDVEQALKACRGTGVKILITCSELEKNTAETVKRFRRYKTNAGYFLRDEPACPSFPDLRAFADRIRAVDDSRVLYLNLLPTYVDWNVLGSVDYADYVRRFIDEVGLGLVSFDHYPVVKDGIRGDFYANLEYVTAECKRAGQPFWAFALATAHNPYPVATRASLRLQIFADLAYGAQGIQYFTYATPGTTIWNFHNAPIDDQYQRTEVYDLVAEVNHEVQALSRVFLGAEMLSVGHTGQEIPAQTKALASLPSPIRSVSADGQGVLVSHLRNGSHDYLMVVNRDIFRSQRVTVEATDAVSRVMPDGTLRPASAYSPTLAVEPGDMLLFEWNNK